MRVIVGKRCPRCSVNAYTPQRARSVLKNIVSIRRFHPRVSSIHDNNHTEPPICVCRASSQLLQVTTHRHDGTVEYWPSKDWSPSTGKQIRQERM
jgi:hypothetical protein